MFTLGQEKFMEEASKPQPIMFTAGAITVINEKGEMSMQKVKVKRYVAGKRPDWADEFEEDDEEEENREAAQVESEEEDEIALAVKMQKKISETNNDENIENEIVNSDDRRLRRLMNRSVDEEDDAGKEVPRTRRREYVPEVISEGEEDSDQEEMLVENEMDLPIPDEDQSDNEDLEDEEIENRRRRLRERVLARHHDGEELLSTMPEEEDEAAEKLKIISDEEEYTSESEYSDSEDEGPRLKPVFVRKKDRLTIKEKEIEEEKQRLVEQQMKKQAEERKRYASKLVEVERRRELEEMASNKSSAALIDSDDGNDEEEYESWKLRELRRIKRDREEREARIKERDDVERLRNMTEEERRQELVNNPKEITNQGVKGKYKFLQKYYHRGAFFLDEEESVLNRDYAQPTLEDHFDKTSLPKVMQVKNFGRSGRTKYTHLRDQDTTPYESWTEENTFATKFMNTRGGGMKQNFTKPSRKKK